MSRRVRHRLARGEDERLDALVERHVARPDELDRDAVQLLDLGGGGVDRGREAGAVRPRVRIEPRTELALLTACERRDAPRVARLALHERERLEDGVVDAGGHLGPLLRADPGGALGVALGGQPPGPRPEHEQERDRDGAGLERGVGPGIADVLVDEGDHGDDPEQDTDGDVAAAAATDQHECGRADRERPDQRVVEAETAKGEQTPEGDQHDADHAAALRRAWPVLGRKREPRTNVGRHARAVGKREQRERQPHERRVDVE